MIQKALAVHGPSIMQLTAAIDVFNATEISCVEELWNAYQDKGEETSGYTFLVDLDADRVVGYACFGPHPLTQGTFDLYSSSPVTRTFSFSTTTGPHVLQVGAYRGSASVDAFTTPGSPPFHEPEMHTGVVRYEEDDPALLYNGGLLFGGRGNRAPRCGK